MIKRGYYETGLCCLCSLRWNRSIRRASSRRSWLTSNSSPLAYPSFGEALRYFLTNDAVQGLATKLAFLDRADRIAYAEAHLPRLAGTLATPPTYTRLRLQSKRVKRRREKDIPSLLKAFGVEGGWALLGSACQSIGVSRLSFIDDFRNLLKARNRVAHDAKVNIPSVDVTTHIDTALLVGMSVDLLLTHILGAYEKSMTQKDAMRRAGDYKPNLRFIDELPKARWGERATINGRVVKAYEDLAVGIIMAKQRAASPLVVVRDARRIPLRLA